MKIPEKLTIAGITYDIKEVEPESPELNYGQFSGGQFLPEQWIAIRNTLTGDYKDQVFVHEFVHGICDALDISHKNIEIDDQFVESFSQLLYQVLKQL